MIKNYLKIAWRNLRRNKSYTFINIGGLALALSVFIIITLFVRHELSYDTFFSKSDHIYRVVLHNEKSTTGDKTKVYIPEPIAGELKQLYPEVEQAVRVTGPGSRSVLLSGKNKIYSKKFALVGPSFFQIFDFPFIAGNAAAAFKNPKSMVITQKLAQALFDSPQEAMGKEVTLKNEQTFTITGIVKNLPSNTHFKIAAFALRGPIYKRYKKWNVFSNKTYLKLHRADQAKALQSKLPEYVKKYQPKPETGQIVSPPELILQPLADIHLHPQNKAGKNSRTFYIQVLLIVAGLILLVACINYMNIATARSAGRAKEIGIRKTAGAYKRQVIGQVMLESTLTCSFAFLSSLVLVELFKPLSLRYLGIQMSSLYHFSAGWIFFLIGLLLVVSLLSGSYAAFYLSSFQPNEVLRGAGLQSGTKAGLFRKVLVVGQFGISIAIIIFSLLISRQMNFVRTNQLNNHTEQIMVINNNDPSFAAHFSAFKHTLEKESAIYSVSAGAIPTQVRGTTSYSESDSTGSTTTTTLNDFSVQYDYFKTMGLKLISGRPFDPGRAKDSTDAIILTQSFAAKNGYKKATGQHIKRPYGELIGIVEDFHSETLFDEDKPVNFRIMDSNYSRMSTILVRLKQGRIGDGINSVRSVWHEFQPAYPLNYSFLNSIFDQNYRAELRLKKIFNIFSGFSILIACLGLFGLAAFAAERRTKEIGVRKVLGATVTNIVGLLSKDFLKLVALGFIIAVPIAYYAMNRWLADFAYKIDIGPGIFLLAGGLALLIAWATVSWQSVRAALANPVESLRSE